jgi:hypothetical protein
MEVLEIPEMGWHFNIMYFYREELEELVSIIDMDN